MKNYKIETQCVQAGYQAKNGEANTLPICQSTTFRYDSTEFVGDLFDLKANGYFYSRLANPTVAAVEDKLNVLEGGVGCMLTSSGQSATLISVINIARSGDHIVSTSEIYGGTYNLFNVTLKQLGIDVTFVKSNDFTALTKAIRPNTKLVFGESLCNPSLSVLDIEQTARIAHDNNIPLIVDNTFATPIFCNPFKFGADIVVHSTSKYLDGHAVSLGGAIVDGGRFDYAASKKFPMLVENDSSYHGISYTKQFRNQCYIVKARVHLMRDLGAMMSPMNAFLLNLGMETLHLRMNCHYSNALKVADFLATHPKVSSVNYPMRKGDKQYTLAKKMLSGGSGVVSFELKTKQDAIKFMDKCKLARIVVHVADVRTGVLHPASSTHRQLTDTALIGAGISPSQIRLSVGIENVEDIIDDLTKALQ